MEPEVHGSHGVERIWSELAVPVEQETQSLGVTDALVVEYMPCPQAVQVTMLLAATVAE
jgi:hypothetical protein